MGLHSEQAASGGKLGNLSHSRKQTARPPQASGHHAKLIAAHGLSQHDVEVVVIKTTGDAIQDRPLSEAGGKGLFTKEIEEALIARTIDIAVHSMKDVPTVLPDGLGIGAILKREDVRDAFISFNYRALAEMPAGAVVGTSSLRRQAQVKRARPDLKVVEFRGNVETRLRKIADGVADATFLALAGLNRLGLTRHVASVIETDVMLPAVAQGAVGIEIRVDDVAASEAIAPLNDAETALCVGAERAFLAKLEGSCRTPIAGLGEIRDGRIYFRGEILTPDGRSYLRTKRDSAATESAAFGMGFEAGAELLEKAGPRYFERVG